ncbi:MAG: hypothetical protein WCA12_11415, partial [Burkholderiales bacterium]
MDLRSCAPATGRNALRKKLRNIGGARSRNGSASPAGRAGWIAPRATNDTSLVDAAHGRVPLAPPAATPPAAA